MIIIAGPCQLESYQHGIESALFLNERLSKYHGVDFYFKTSFDKANRTSGNSKRGAGIDVLVETFEEIKTKRIKTLTDVHETWQCDEVAGVCDVLQIPALLCRQTDLINAAADTGCIVNIKKGQFMSPHDMKYAKEKAQRIDTNFPIALSNPYKAKHKEVWLTERGTFFGYGNLVVDFRSLVIMSQENRDARIIFDCTHSTQFPGASGGKSGCNRDYALPLAKAAIAVGVAGLFLECHSNPSQAPSDGECMIPWNVLDNFFEQTIGDKRK